jgi:hypothetical protein
VACERHFVLFWEGELVSTEGDGFSWEGGSKRKHMVKGKMRFLNKEAVCMYDDRAQ